MGAQGACLLGRTRTGAQEALHVREDGEWVSRSRGGSRFKVCHGRATLKCLQEEETGPGGTEHPVYDAVASASMRQ